MNFVFATVIFATVNLYFFKGKNELIVQYVPTLEQNKYTLVHAKNGHPWEEINMKRSGNWFYQLIPYDSTIKTIAFYFKSGSIIDDNAGLLYLYEVKLYPKMIFAVSLKQLEQMLRSAEKKLNAQTTKHDISEARTSIDYVREILNQIPDPMYECMFRIEKKRLLDLADDLMSK